MSRAGEAAEAKGSCIEGTPEEKQKSETEGGEAGLERIKVDGEILRIQLKN